MANNNPESDKEPIALEELLSSVEKSKALDALLNDVIQDEISKQFKEKETRKQHIITELIAASKIYEKMPITRLSIKIGVDMNEILDLLEEIILKNEFSGIIISGDELLFKKVPRQQELDQKPMHVIKSNEDVPMQPAIQPIQRKRVDLKFKVMGQKPAVQGGEGATPLAMEVEITPVASHVQLKVTITNITNHPVENVVLKFLVEGRVMLARTQPPNYRLTDLEDGITIPSIPAQGYRRVLFYFSPLECKPVEIFVLLQYNDEDGIFKDEHVSQRIDLSIPEFIPKEKPIDEIEFQQLVHSLAFKAMKSFAMPSAIESSKAYLLVKEILLINQFELVGEKFNEDDGNFLGWYYTKVKGISSDVDDFIIIGQILNSKIEFFGMGNGASILLCACTHFANSLRQELVSRHVIAKDVELIELFCPTCGGTLSRSPVQGELYTCKFCGAKMQF